MSPFIPTTKASASSALVVLCAAIVVALCSLAGTFQLTRSLMQRERLQWQDRTNAEAVRVAAQLRMELPDHFSSLSRVGARWQLQGRPLDPTDWQTAMRLFFESPGGLHRITWVDASRKR